MSKIEFNQDVLIMDIKKKQRSEGLNKKEVCDLLGFSRATVNRIEIGGVPDISTLLRFVNWTGTDINRYFKKV